MKIKSVIIDDKSNIRDLIQSIIEDNFSDIEIAGTGNSVLSGLKEINTKKPQLVFMDIELPDGSGFDILENIQDKDIKVIFISAFNQYAVKAFEYSAADYILKPINILSLIKSVNKVINTLEEQNNYSILLENMRSEFPTKLALQVKDEIQYINVDDIICITAEGRYSTIHANNGNKYLESKIISYFEDILNNQYFLRIHKSNLINLNYVKSFKKIGDGQVTMTDNSVFNVSRSRKDEFLKKMDKL